MDKTKKKMLAMIVVAGLLPTGAHAGDPALSPLPYLGAVIAHQGNEALRIIRAQVKEDIRIWLPVLESVEKEPIHAAAPEQPKG